MCQQLLLSVSSLNVLDQTAFSVLYIYCFNYFFNRLCVILTPIPESDSHYQSCLCSAWISCWCKSRILMCTQVFKSLCFKRTFARPFTLFLVFCYCRVASFKGKSILHDPTVFPELLYIPCVNIFDCTVLDLRHSFNYMVLYI